MAAFRIAAVAAALAGLLWFQFVNTASAGELTRTGLDLFDSRPAQRLLFIGNSRMYRNDMPAMVRRIADSAGAPVKYQNRMHALPGAGFTDHAADPQVRRLLAQPWDHVILHAESGAHVEDESRARFARAGTSLLARAKGAGNRTSLVVGWVYGEAFYRERPPGARDSYHDAIQADHRSLAESNGAALINVGSVWRLVEAARPDVALAPDSNHPSVHGTYVYALTVYGHLSGADVSAATYVPEGMTAEEAASIRAAVSAYLAGAPS